MLGYILIKGQGKRNMGIAWHGFCQVFGGLEGCLEDLLSNKPLETINYASNISTNSTVRHQPNSANQQNTVYHNSCPHHSCARCPPSKNRRACKNNRRTQNPNTEDFCHPDVQSWETLGKKTKIDVLKITIAQGITEKDHRNKALWHCLTICDESCHPPISLAIRIPLSHL